MFMANQNAIGSEMHMRKGSLPESISFAEGSRNHYNYISSLPLSINNTMNFNHNSSLEKQLIK
jgi:hypothetical protein